MIDLRSWHLWAGAGTLILGLTVVGRAMAANRSTTLPTGGQTGSTSNARAQALWGPLEFVAAPTTSNPEGIRITNGWDTANIVSVPIPQIGKSIPFHKRGAARLQALWSAWEAAGLLPLVLSFDGSWVPRFIRGSTTTLSNHAFGAALDINARWNPLGQAGPPEGQEGSTVALARVATGLGWGWGGNYRSRPDPMHFELVA